ncbi:hypothetical protein FB45DRAFT_1094042 [Roridomyces roridus]|uniref:Uncharacterized protein n=1 Tax=Roridomyces roridus TaxID=1738132 RepID=A0AAD7BG12_9AGAR|nr:hypothetical protein FB45DRAFT_1094042 [Roridomyces roridus]
MSFFTRLSAFIKATLLYIRSLIPRPFGVHIRHAILLSVTDVEKQIVADIPEMKNRVFDIEMGVLDSSAITPQEDIVTLPTLKSIPPLKSVIQQVVPFFPLGDVTNAPRTPPRRLAFKGNEENISPTRSQTPRKPTPLRRMPRYLNFTGNSPLEVSPAKASLKSSCSSMTPFPLDGSPRGFKTSTPVVGPLRLEAGLANTSNRSLNLAVRIRSAIYGRKADDDDDESLAARDLFNCDSICSGAALDGVLKLIQDLDEEQDYGTPVRIQSTSYSPSKGSPSMLPYLRGRSLSFASTLSNSSSGAFDDLLASIERKLPGNEWHDIVQFSDSVESLEEEAHWSDVVSEPTPKKTNNAHPDSQKTAENRQNSREKIEA